MIKRKKLQPWQSNIIICNEIIENLFLLIWIYKHLLPY